MEIKVHEILTSGCTALCLLAAPSVSAQLSATETDRLFASDAAQADSYGYAVDVDGNRAVVGARYDDDAGSGSGAAYVYARNLLTGLWEEETKLVMPGAAEGDNFGASVAISGDSIVVGAPQDDINVGSNLHGSAWVFTRDGGGWDAGVELLPQDADLAYQNYGVAVDIDDETIVVGVAYDNDQDVASGSAYVFELDAGTWQKTGKLLPPSAGSNQNFGWSVAVDKNTVIVGAPHWTDAGVGAAYAFTPSGSWATPNSDTLPVMDNLAADQFGWSVAVSGDIAVVGARMDDDLGNGNESGSITVFERASGDWSNAGKLVASDGEVSDQFGTAVATNGAAVVVGSLRSGPGVRGSIYSFSDPGSGWSEDEVLWPTADAADVSFVQQFGSSVALDGGTLLVGAPTSDIYNGSSFVFVAGAVFAYGINATSIPTADGTQSLSVLAPPGTFLTDVAAVDPAMLGPPPPDVSFPVGALGFTVHGLTPGAAVEVEIRLPEGAVATSYYKYSDHWYEFLDDGATGATLMPGKVILRLLDGGRGDHDETADGVITDPGAPGLAVINETVFEDGFEE